MSPECKQRIEKFFEFVRKVKKRIAELLIRRDIAEKKLAEVKGGLEEPTNPNDGGKPYTYGTGH